MGDATNLRSAGSDSDGIDSAGHLLSDPAVALAAARTALETPDLPPQERAVALCAVGCAAYYANRMPEAVRLLGEAETLAVDPEVRAEILLTLAPAMSKEGQPEQALTLLQDPCFDTSARLAGHAHNQRGIILIETGRLPEALTDITEAVRLLRSVGDSHRATRALVNLGVVTSMMGRLEDSERWYQEARALGIETDQPVVAAVIEGNLGYIASRRGDFATAIEWFDRARRGFEEFGDVDLLTANLEVDYARTLLDIGLTNDAADAAGRAIVSASAGGNQMLELQSRLLLAEATIQADQPRRARRQIELALDLAQRLDHRASLLKASYLTAELAPDESEQSAFDDAAATELAWFVQAGWGREAYAWTLRRAMRWWLERPNEVRALIEAADAGTSDLDVDPVARSLGAMLLAATSGDRRRLDAEFDRALGAIQILADMINVAEHRGTSIWLLRPIAEVAIETSLRAGDPPERMLHIFERCRGAIPTPSHDRPATAGSDDHVSDLRDARVALSETKLAGGDVAAATETVRALEHRIRDRRRTIRPIVDDVGTPLLADLPDDTVYVGQIVSRGRIVTVTVRNGRVRTHELAALDQITPHLRAQRAGLRRMGDRRRNGGDEVVSRIRETNETLDALLIRPLELGDAARVVFTPAVQIRHAAWSALPALADRDLTLTRSLHSWNSDDERLSIGRFAFLEGPELAHGRAELETVERIWRQQATFVDNALVDKATIDDAIAAFSTADLLHLSVHGAFRTDNPLFSFLRFTDGDLTVLRMSELARVPAVVVLASCDGAASNRRTAIGDDVIGTALELSRLGARAVIAPMVAVNDAAAADFSVVLHTGLASGASIDEAMHRARTSLLETGEPAPTATAWSFQVLGGRSTREPFVRSP